MTDKQTPKVNWSEKDQFYWLRGAFDEVLTFDSVLDAQAAAHRIEIDLAVKARETLIADWLRNDAEAVVGGDLTHAAYLIADCIKDGEHLK
jgi:hypothetical protein